MDFVWADRRNSNKFDARCTNTHRRTDAHWTAAAHTHAPKNVEVIREETHSTSSDYSIFFLCFRVFLFSSSSFYSASSSCRAVVVSILECPFFNGISLHFFRRASGQPNENIKMDFEDWRATTTKTTTAMATKTHFFRFNFNECQHSHTKLPCVCPFCYDLDISQAQNIYSVENDFLLDDDAPPIKKIVRGHEQHYREHTKDILCTKETKKQYNTPNHWYPV